MAGRDLTVDATLAEIAKDEPYYRQPGSWPKLVEGQVAAEPMRGGVTVSGGELASPSLTVRLGALPFTSRRNLFGG